MCAMPARRRRAMLLAALLARSERSANAMLLTCLQRAFTLLGPCQPCFGALSAAATPAGGVDVGAALAALGGSLTSLPASVRQCCAALAPVNEANCLCDPTVADAVSTFTASSTASAASIMPQIEQVCGFALKVTQPSGACAATPAAQAVQAAQPPRPPPPDADIMFEITSASGGGGGIVPISSAVNATRTAAPPVAVQSAAAMSSPPPPPPPQQAQPAQPAVLVQALAGAAPGPAACPVPPPPLLALALCAGLCRSDADCRAGRACCSNGCGRVCFAAPAPQ